MSSISQTVPNFVLGISEQPDQLKSLGQVRDLVNGVPDVTRMLGKRPGAEHIRQLQGANEHNGHWFDIYRDDDNIYIGRIVPAANNGTVDVWRLVDGPLNRYPGSPNNPTRHYVNVTIHGTGYTANAQGLDANADNFDTDFQNVAVTGPGGTAGLTINARVDGDGRMQAAYINTLGTGWETGMTGTFTIDGIQSTLQYFEGIAGEQCHVNLDDDPVTPYFVQSGESKQIAPAAAVAALDYLRGPNNDPNNATRFKTLTINDTTIILNQTIVARMSDAAADIEPVFDRRGFVSLEQIAFSQVYQFNIIRANGDRIEIVSEATGATDATGEAILDDLVGKVNAVANFTATKIGDGLLIETTLPANENFSLETPERQLLGVFTDEVQDITQLPDQCENGYRVKITNSGTVEDDYYVRFEGANGNDGQGIWVEWRGPEVPFVIDNTTMPHVMVLMSDLSFTVSRGNWTQRLVGDNISNPEPSFINNRINNICLFRNRLGFLSGQNIALSRAGDYRNWFAVTALAITPADPIDLSVSSSQPAVLWDSIEVNAGLLLFSKAEQFMMTTDNDVLSAETAKINFVSAYNYNEKVPPFTLGTTIGFVNDESANSRLYEMAAPAREGEPQVIEQSKIISSLYPTGINRIATSKNNAVVLTAVNDTNTVWGYRYFNSTERRLQSAWFKFILSGNLIYHTIIKDTWYGVIRNLDTVPDPDVNTVSFQKMDLKTTDVTYNYKDVDYGMVVRLDNMVRVEHDDLTYNTANDNTTFNLADIGWNDTAWTYDQTKVDGNNTGVKCFQIGNGINEECVDVLINNADHENRFNAAFTQITLDGNWEEQIEVTITNNDATGLPDGNFVSEGTTRLTGAGSGMRLSGRVENGIITQVVISNFGTGYTDGSTIELTNATNSEFRVDVTDLDLWMGYEYELDVDFPTIYPRRSNGSSSTADVNGSLVLHRYKFNMAKVGTYEFDLDRLGRNSFTHDHETRYADSYDANDAPILNTDTVTLPVYDRNVNTNVHLKSEYPLPVTLISLTWEGEYTNLSYKRS
jgi:hypothetical protein